MGSVTSAGPGELFVSLAQSVSELVFVWRANGEMVYVNPAFERETGLRLEDFGFQNPENPFVVPDDLPGVLAAMAAFAASPALVSPPIENRFFDAWGRVHRISSRVHKITWAGEPANLIVSTLLDAPGRGEADDAFQKLVEAADDGILQLAADARIVYSNRRMQSLAGRRHVDLAKATLPSLLVDEDRGVADAALARLRAGEPTAAFQARLEHGDTWVDVKLARLDGSYHGAVTLAIVRDIGEQRRAEETRRRDTRRLQLAITATADAIWEWDLVSNKTYYSPRWYEMLGYADQQFEMDFDAWKSLCHPDDLQPTLDAVQSLLTGERRPGYEAEFRMRVADGTWRWILGRGNVVERDAAGRPVLLSGTNTDITARKHAEAALAENERRLRFLADNLPTAMLYQIIRDRSGRRHFSYVSAGVMYAHGLTPTEAYADAERLYDQIHADDRARVEAAEAESMRTGALFVVETRLRHPERGLRWALFRSAPRPLPDGSVIWDGVELDITELKEAAQAREHLEESLRQAQKMESVGRLAGGIAHDFNNLLTAIKGNVSLALRRTAAPEQQRDWLEAANAATDSAARLTRQLLTFSRKQVIAPRVIDLNHIVGHLLKMLGRLLGEHITLVTELAGDLGAVRADAGQLEQVIVNLAINSRDAMPRGGTLTLRTGNVYRDADDARGIPAGDYVCITVVDTGEGMTDEIMAHIFEPFFTTKASGHGTGLGLSMVYGAVTQNQGHIDVRSSPGQGATFTICFPRVDEAPSPRPPVAPATSEPATGTIVVVEDDVRVRIVVEQALRLQGYRVLAFADGETALAAVRQLKEPVHVLITDVMMPGLSGRELATRLRAERPELRVLYTSGYPSDEIAHHGVLEEGLEFLEKPYSPDALAARVRQVMGR